MGRRSTVQGSHAKPGSFFSSGVRACHPLSWPSAAGEGFVRTARLHSARWAQPLRIQRTGGAR